MLAFIRFLQLRSDDHSLFLNDWLVKILQIHNAIAVSASGPNSTFIADTRLLLCTMFHSV